MSIRGRIMAGTVKSTKMTRTIIVRRNYFHFIPKYQRCGGQLLVCGLLMRTFRALLVAYTQSVTLAFQLCQRLLITSTDMAKPSQAT